MKNKKKAEFTEEEVRVQYTNEQLDMLVDDTQPDNRLMDLFPNNISFQGLTGKDNTHQLDFIRKNSFSLRDTPRLPMTPKDSQQHYSCKDSAAKVS